MVRMTEPTTLESFGEKPPIYTTVEDYQREMKELSDARKRLGPLEKELADAQRELSEAEREFLRARDEYETKWRGLRQVTRNMRYWQTRIAALTTRYEALRAIGWRYLRGSQRPEYQRLRGLLPAANARLMYWTDEQTTIINKINTERTGFTYLRDAVLGATATLQELRAEYNSVRTQIATLEDTISRKVIEEWLGDEACSGMDIFWNALDKQYVVRKPRVKDQLIGELVRREKKLGLTYTGSIETSEGHDVPLAVEITTVTLVREKDPAAIAEVERQLDRKTMDYMARNAWANLMPSFEKKGIEYNGEHHILKIRLYPFKVPDYPTAHLLIERKSRYIPDRKYEADISLV
jgi:hypothetical protein